MNRKLAEYENRIALLTQEIQRLHENIGNKNEEVNRLQGQLRTLQQDIDSSRRGQSEYEYKITQINQEWQSKFSTFESRFNQLNNEND